MLAAQAIERLSRDLSSAIGAMGLSSGAFGQPELVEKPTKEAERIFQGYAKAKPNKEDAYAAARAFLRGHPLDTWQRDLIASALAEPVREQSGAMVLEHNRFSTLLLSYESEANRGELWRLTWHGMLYSYFNYDPISSVKNDVARKGWEELRSFLERTWPLIDREAGTSVVPDWVTVLRQEPEVLSTNPAEKYARAYLEGDTEPTDQLAADLGIPPSSWFWHALVLGAVQDAIANSDAEFRRLVPRLIQLVQGRTAFRDEAIEQILIRYHACKSAPPDERLRDYVVSPSVWKNPKLKAAGIATAWNRVPDPVWMMVLGWVNERNLKDFFDILASRNQADEGRLAFWSKYLKQITWTRLVFSADTMYLKNRNPAIRDLIAREEGAYAELTAKRDVDAFMMQIGSYIIIEFSKKPNACYVYGTNSLPYDRYERYYAGNTDDLAYGFHGECAARIVHRGDWQERAAYQLRVLGIVPDRPSAQWATAAAAKAPHSAAHESQTYIVQSSATSAPGQPALQASHRTASDAPSGAVFTMRRLEDLVKEYPRAFIKDSRGASGGRLWVEDPNQSASLARELVTLGFKWAASRTAWYYPEQ